MSALLRSVLVLASVASLVSCVPAPAPDPAQSREAIVGGVTDEGHTSVVALTVFGSSEFCTGTVIAPRTVLTAAHCLAESGYPAASILVFFGTVVGGEGLLMRVTNAEYHPDFATDSQGYVYNDVAVLTLEQDAPVKPMAWQRTPLEDISGQTVTFVGYGVTDGRTQTGNDTRRTVDDVVTSINDNPGYVHFEGTGTSGTCQGDSGGPTLLNRGGVETVIAVTSIGVVGCLGASDNTRVDLHADWITPRAPMPVEIKVSEPVDGSWVGSAFSVAADATSPAGVTELALFVDGVDTALTCPTPPCSFDLRDIPDGDHILTLQGTGADGGTGAAEVWVTVVTQEFGITCKADSDCRSGICAGWQAGTGYCSQACAQDADCPVHSDCTVVYAKKVCGEPQSKPGCSVSGRTTGGAGGLLALLAGVLVLGGRRRGALALVLLLATLALTLAACGDNLWGAQNDAGYPQRSRPVTDAGAQEDAFILAGVGDPCTATAQIDQGDCADGLLCITADLTPVAVNGYCVLPCATGLDCPEGSTCVHGTTNSMFCLKSCAEETECRTADGYHCMERDGAQVCWSWYVPPGTNDGGACSSPDGGPWVDSEDRLFGESKQLLAPDGGVIEVQPLVVAKGTTVAASFVSATSGFGGGGTRIGVTASQDQAATFGPAVVVKDAVTSRKSDPVLAMDATGAHLYLGWIGYDRSGGTANNYHVFVARSDDNGVSWPTTQIYDATSTDSGATAIARPWLATGPGGTIYVAYMLGTGASTAIKVVRSSDLAATWDAPVLVNDSTRTPTSRGLPHVAAYGDGDVLVGWGEIGAAAEPNGDAANDIFVARWDAGGTWGTGTFGTNVKANADSDRVVSNTLAIVPSATTDKLYVVYVAGPPDSQRWDVRMTWSGNRGDTFSASSIKINDDPSCAIHVLPTAVVDADDRLHVAWYDTRFGLDAGGFFYSMWDSTVGTPSPSEFVSDATFTYSTATRGQNRLGSYAGLVIDGTRIYAVWADPRGVANTSHIRMASGTLQ
jgi:V8-like Glu-specific endopeptidase